MPYKSCPNCNRTSYSASDAGIWFCPYCGSDITFVKGLVFDPDKKIKLYEDKTNKKEEHNSLRILTR